MEKKLTLSIRANEFLFDYRRIIFWPRKKILLTTDLHWGKATFFQKHGIAIPDSVFDHDLKRLGEVLEEYQAETFIVLGDLIHHEKSLSHSLIEKVARFRHQYPCEMILMKGNHDRFTHFPESWGLIEEKELIYEDYLFTHELKKKTNYFQFSGHLHPMMRFRAGADKLRLPVFLLNTDRCLLPAFSLLTGGQDMKLSSQEKAIAVTEDGVELFT